MSIKDFVIANVKPEDYYASRFPNWNKVSRPNIRCCFHEDKDPSLTLALRNGGARCHAASCSKRIGNIVHFEAQLKDIPESIAARRLYGEFVHRIISKKEVERYRQNLAEHGLTVLKIKKEMGLNAGHIRRFSIGYDPTKRRVTIPIYDQFGNCTNIRFYKLPSDRTKTDTAKIYNQKGYGYLELFPWNEINNFKKDKPLYFMASEKETMLAITDGLQAFCASCGEGSWSPEWDHIVRNRDVILVLDKDRGGESAREKLKAIFVKANAKSVRIANFKFKQKRPDRKDFADWVLKEKHLPRELIKYVSKPEPNTRREPKDTSSDRHSVSTTGSFSLSGQEPIDEDANQQPIQDYPELPDFASKGLVDIVCISSRSDLLNKRIRTQGIVAARSPTTFSVPWRFLIRAKGRPEFEYSLPMGRDLLRFVRADDDTILQSLQKITGNNQIEIEPLEFITATQVEIIPIAAVDRDVPYVVQSCYFFGQEIKDNVPYYFEIIPTSEIRTQQTLGIITHCAPISKTIDRFELTADTEKELKQFQPDETESVWQKLKAVAHEISEHHTLVYNRMDWHMVALLSWACPIGFRFPHEPEIQRAHMNALALGDTETGKSKVTRKLQEVFNCGVFVNAENCTYVGLVGGAIKMGNGQLMLRWGRIPLSDKQLVILEELSGLSVSDIANMSEIRSSGIARLDKGGINSNTNARTRLICLSNVRSQHKTLSSYLFGVKAIQELVGHGEDIARFDLITTLVDSEVDVSIINAEFATIAKRKPKLTIHGLRKLIHFIWSLTPERIGFSDSAYEECLSQTKILSGIYHPSIPIFKGGSGRYKLARIAVAIACLQFSFRGNKETGKIIVGKDHIRAAAKLLRLIYDKPSFGYKQYSEQMFDRDTVHEPLAAERIFSDRIADKRTLPRILDSLIHLTRFTNDELMAVAGLTMTFASQITSAMINSRIIRKGEANVWEITPPGKLWMEQFSAKLKRK